MSRSSTRGDGGMCTTMDAGINISLRCKQTASASVASWVRTLTVATPGCARRDEGAVLAVLARAPRVRAIQTLPEERRPFGSQRAQRHAATPPHRGHSDSRLGGASWLCVCGGGGGRQERVIGRRCPSANACLLARCSCRAIVPRCAGSCLLGQCPPGADSLSAWRSTVACWSGHRHRHMEPATASYLTTVVTLFYCFEHTGPQDNVLIPVLDKPHVILLHPKLVDARIMYQIIINVYVSRNTFFVNIRPL